MSRATIIVEGLVSRDVQVKYTQAGQAVANVTVPHMPQRKNRDTGEWVDAASATMWVEASLWDEAAEAAADIRKGDVVRITGQPQLDTYEGRNGQGVKIVVKSATVGLVKRGEARQVPATAPQTSGSGQWAAAPIPGAQAGAQQGWVDDAEVPF